VKSFGVKNDGKGLDYFIPAKDGIIDKDLPLSHRFGYIGVVMGAALNTKKLPVHKLKELCGKINYPIVLLGGKEDRKAGDEISSLDSIRIYNSCGKFSLNESADLIRYAQFIITHDTGLMHIAAAFQKPMVSVWGNTVPKFGMSPYYGDSSVKDIREEISLSCRPCSKIGYRKCPRKHFKCMELQDMNKIAKEVLSILEKCAT
jgi:heptosyltransferase-2